MPGPAASTLTIDVHTNPLTSVFDMLCTKINDGLPQLAKERPDDATFYRDRIECLLNNDAFIGNLITTTSESSPIKTLNGNATVYIKASPLLIECLIAAHNQNWEFFVIKMNEFANHLR